MKVLQLHISSIFLYPIRIAVKMKLSKTEQKNMSSAIFPGVGSAPLSPFTLSLYSRCKTVTLHYTEIHSLQVKTLTHGFCSFPPIQQWSQSRPQLKPPLHKGQRLMEKSRQTHPSNTCMLNLSNPLLEEYQHPLDLSYDKLVFDNGIMLLLAKLPT